MLRDIVSNIVLLSLILSVVTSLFSQYAYVFRPRVSKANVSDL